jgi:hypothetical protein
MEETAHAQASVHSDQRMAWVCRAVCTMSQKPLRHLIHVSSPDVSKLGSVIVLDLADEDEAIKMAQKLARETGRRVTVRDATLVLIKTIPATSVH